MLSPQSVIDDCKPAHFLHTASEHIFTNLSLVSYTTVCLYQSLKENCVNDVTELPFNMWQNFVRCLVIYRVCSQIFFCWAKVRRKIALCSSELLLDTYWNFMWTFERSFIKKSREQRMKFVHFACITLHNTLGGSSVGGNQVTDLLWEVDYRREGKGSYYFESTHLQYIPLRKDIIEVQVAETTGELVKIWSRQYDLQIKDRTNMIGGALLWFFPDRFSGGRQMGFSSTWNDIKM